MFKTRGGGQRLFEQCLKKLHNWYVMANPNIESKAISSQFEKESHGDWLSVEHNSAVANNLKQKYGEQYFSRENDFISNQGKSWQF